MISLYQQHVRRWSGGCGSDQCAGAFKKCFARGAVPCDVFMVGEAPGESEDVLGRPFVGPAGKLLDSIITAALGDWPKLRIAFTNIVSCVPRDDVTGTKKATEPDLDQIKACRPRLLEFVKMCRPSLVVCVGKLAGKYFSIPDGIPVPTVIEVTHPAAILRANVAQQSLMRRRVEVNLSAAVEELLQGGDDAGTQP